MTKSTHRPAALALKWRLVLGYTAATLVTLSGASLYLYHGLESNFEAEDRELLADNIAQVRTAVTKRPGDLFEAAHLIARPLSNLQLEKYYGRLIDERNVTVLETPEIEKLLPPEGAFPQPAPTQENIRSLAKSKSADGVPLFLASAWVDRGPGQSPLLYQVFLDARHVYGWLDDYRLRLALMVAGGTLAAAMLGIVLTKRGLLPLEAITASVRRVSAEELDERLIEKRWPSELAALATEFDRMLSRLRDSFQRLAQFSADAAHEFRTPLNNLMVSTGVILSRDRPPEDYRNALAANLDEFERLKRMVDALLFLARADNAEEQLVRKRFAGGPLCRGLVDFFSALAEERGVELVCEGEAEVTADETLFRQAVSNLLSNALRHSPSHQQVRLTIAPKGDGGCVVSVGDSGPGISSEHLPHLFARFYRVDASRTGSHDGAGLGLALVKTVMALHHGSVEVESAVGQGTRFSLHFPPASLSPPIPAANRSAPSSRRKAVR